MMRNHFVLEHVLICLTYYLYFLFKYSTVTYDHSFSSHFSNSAIEEIAVFQIILCNSSYGCIDKTYSYYEFLFFFFLHIELNCFYICLSKDFYP